MSNLPEDLKYTKEHEWIKLEGHLAVVGITEYAAEQLGDVVHVELPQPSDEFTKGESFGVVESVKSVSDLYSPVAGKISEVNDVLIENSGIINEEPYTEGWIIKLEIENESELSELMSSKEYESFLSEEA